MNVKLWLILVVIVSLIIFLWINSMLDPIKYSRTFDSIVTSVERVPQLLSLPKDLEYTSLRLSLIHISEPTRRS